MKSLVILLSLSLSTAAFADLPYREQITKDPAHIVAPHGSPEDWGLSKKEWDRYLEIMKGGAAYYASDMPPVMVLGMYTDNENDLRRYAELLANFERDKVDRIQRIQRAYDNAMNELYPDAKIIDLDILRERGVLPQKQISENTKHKPRFGDNIAFFASPGCRNCLAKIESVSTRFPSNSIEVYFNGTDQEFSNWIGASNHKPEWYSEKNISFSRDEGQSSTYNAKPGTIFIVRGRELYEADI